MSKIPVRQTIAEAYRFTFAGLDKVIALIWLPIILMTVGDYFVSGPYLLGMANAMESGDAALLGPILVGQLGYNLVQLVLTVVIAVAICREILKPLDRPSFLRFSLGLTELRVVGAMLAIYLLLTLVAFLCVVGGMILSGAGLPAGGGTPEQQAMALALLIGLVFSPLLIAGFLRLAYFVVPSVVMDGKFGLEQSWLLAKGNVWRLLAVCLAVTLPPLLVYGVLHSLVMGPSSMDLSTLLGQAPARAHQSAEQLRQTVSHLPLLKGIDFVLAPFVFGLVCSAPAFAYKAVKSGQ